MSVTNDDTLTGRSFDRIQDTADAIAGDVKAEAKGRLREAVGAVGAIAGDVKAEAKGRLRDAVGLASEAYDQTRDRAAGAVDRADSFLRDRSLIVLGVVAGAALLAGFALRGGRKPRPEPEAAPKTVH